MIVPLPVSHDSTSRFTLRQLSITMRNATKVICTYPFLCLLSLVSVRETWRNTNSEPCDRIEMWRGGLGWAWMFLALSSAGTSLSKQCSVSRSRSSNRTGAINASGSRRKHHCFSHEKLRFRSASRTRPNLPCRKDCARIFPKHRLLHFVFGTQPLTQPLTVMSIYCLIGFADWPEAETVGPTAHHLVELRHHLSRRIRFWGQMSRRFCSSGWDALSNLVFDRPEKTG
jgi:hypothetical protein